MDFFVLGEAEIVTGFGFAGLEGKAVSTREEALTAFREAIRPGSGLKVLILTEDCADSLGQELVDWQLNGDYPLVVEVPGLSGTRPDRKSLVQAIREAIGINV